MRENMEGVTGGEEKKRELVGGWVEGREGVVKGLEGVGEEVERFGEVLEQGYFYNFLCVFLDVLYIITCIYMLQRRGSERVGRGGRRGGEVFD